MMKSKPAGNIAATENAALSAATAIMGGAPAKPAPTKAKAKKRPKSKFRHKGARDTSDKGPY